MSGFYKKQFGPKGKQRVHTDYSIEDQEFEVELPYPSAQVPEPGVRQDFH